MEILVCKRSVFWGFGLYFQILVMIFLAILKNTPKYMWFCQFRREYWKFIISRTTRYTDGKLPYHGKKWEDRCSHFRCSWWNRLVSFLNERWTIQLLTHIKFEIQTSNFGPKIGLARREVGNLLISISYLKGYAIWSKRPTVPYITIKITCIMMRDNISGNIRSKNERSRPWRPKNRLIWGDFSPKMHENGGKNQ